MRNQLLLITTILVVGTAIVSALAFYLRPRPDLLTKLFNESTGLSDMQKQVAGIKTQKELEGLSKELPIFEPSVVVSYSRTLSYQRVILTTEEPLVAVSAYYYRNLSGWQKKEDKMAGNTQELVFVKGRSQISIKISSSEETEETIINLNYAPDITL